MSALTPEKLAELRRLLDANEVPWSAHRPSPNYARYEIRDDRGYDLAYTVEDALGGNAEIIVAAVNALPALLDAAAERDELAAKVERVRAMHRPAYNDAARSPLCPDCAAKAGVHPCGCWADTDYEPVCAVCNEGHKGMSVPWPCPTIRALCGAES